jgi:hypothetical protein
MSNPSEREADMVTPNDDAWAANMRTSDYI